jgi:UDP-GlcNAc3NAcA epimerase
LKKIISIIGARPQFIKHAPMQLELQKHFNALTLHTGQHYDEKMSAVFFNELNISAPDFVLDIGGAHLQGAQTAVMLAETEKVFCFENPDAVIVYGDTNSTLAGVLAAVKLQIPVIHIEAGLRSFNRTMPEEINRIVADNFSQLLFCPTAAAIDNLRKEGIDHKHIYLCGDVMADMIQLILPEISLKLDEPYYFATIHRPYNTDDVTRLTAILEEFQRLNHPIIFSLHPRTLKRLQTFGIDPVKYTNIRFVEPLGYADSISYQKFAACVITDSGGIQKEAYILKKKCITLRSETEWEETLTNGWNTLVFEDLSSLHEEVTKLPGAYTNNLYGDGSAARFITEVINKYLYQ